MVLKTISSWLGFAKNSTKATPRASRPEVTRLLNHAVQSATGWTGMMALEPRTLLSASFDPPLPHTTLAPGSAPEGVVLGDFNGDGDLDMASVNAGTNNVAIWMNTGGVLGTAAHNPTSTLPAGASLRGVVSADFDNDGYDDLAFRSNTGRITVWHSRGDGSFSAMTTIPFAAQPTALAAGDFNSDGIPDLLVISGGQLDLYANNGAGNFALATSLGGFTDCVTVGDFNNDGLNDIAGDGGIYRNNGGSFTQVVGGVGGDSVVAQDFNNDGRVDFAFAYRIIVTPPRVGVAVYLSNGAGFTSYTRDTGLLYAYPASIASEDFNGDGYFDIAATSRGSTTGIAVLENDHNGFVNLVGTFAAGAAPVSLITGDLGNGKPALIVANSGSGSNSVSVLVNTTVDQTSFPFVYNHFLNNTTEYATGVGPQAIVTADLDGNGNLDVVVANANSGTISVFFNYGVGTFSPTNAKETDGQPLYNRVDYVMGGAPSGLVAADFNGDGKIDLAVTDAGRRSVFVLLNQYTPYKRLVNPTNGAVTYTGGRTKLFKADYAGRLTVTTGLDTAIRTYAVGNGPQSVAAADVDNDGDKDLLVANASDNSVSILLNNGGGTFAAAYHIRGGFAGPSSIVAGNLDNDVNNLIDFAVVNRGSNSVTVVSNDGSAFRNYKDIDYSKLTSAGLPNPRYLQTIKAPSTYTVPGRAYALAIGDFDGDQRNDIAVVSDQTKTLTILWNEENPDYAPGDTPWPPVLFFSQSYVELTDYALGLAVVDLDGIYSNQPVADDLVIIHKNTSEHTNIMSVLIRTDAGNTRNLSYDTYVYNTGNTPVFVAGADLNNDARQDLVVANYAGNSMSVYLSHMFNPNSYKLNGVAYLRGIVGNAQIRTYFGQGAYEGTAYEDKFSRDKFYTISANSMEVNALRWDSSGLVTPDKAATSVWIAKDQTGTLWLFKVVVDGVTLFEVQNFGDEILLRDAPVAWLTLLNSLVTDSGPGVSRSMGVGSTFTDATGSKGEVVKMDATLPYNPGEKFVLVKWTNDNDPNVDWSYYHASLGVALNLRDDAGDIAGDGWSIAETVQIAATDPNASETDPTGEGKGTFTITRSGTRGALNLRLGISGTATTGSDYRLLEPTTLDPTNPLTIRSGEVRLTVQSTTTIEVVPVNDAVAENTETVIAKLLAQSGGVRYRYDTRLDPTVAGYVDTVKIADNEPQVMVQKIADTTEGGSAGVFRITRTAESYTNALRVNFALAGTAQFGSTRDYVVAGNGVNVATPNSAVILAGEEFVDVTISAWDTEINESTETVIMNLVGNAAYTLDPVVTNRTATMNVINNAPTVKIEKLADATEGGATGLFRITRTSPTNVGTLTVKFNRAGTASAWGSDDYILSGNGVNSAYPTSATIAAGQDFVDVTLTATDSNIAESTETAILTLQSGANYVLDPLVSNRSATATITNNASTVRLEKLADTSEGGAPGTFRIWRSGGSNLSALKVDFTLAGTATIWSSADFVLSGTGVTGGYAPSATLAAGADYVDVTVTATDDAVAEVTETLIVNLRSSSNYLLDPILANRTATVNIADNEPVVKIERLADAAEGGAHGTFRVTRSGGTNLTALTVAFTLSGTASTQYGVDYILTGNGVNERYPNSVTIAPGTDFVDITVNPVDDRLAEPTETVILTLRTSAAYTLDTTPANRTATVNIVDNEPIVKIEKLADTAEGGAAGTFRITRIGGTTANAMTVNFNRAGTAYYSMDYTMSGNGVSAGYPTSAVIAAGDTYVDVTVAPVDDHTAEPTETVILNLATNAAYTLDATPANRTATVNIVDNEPLVTILATTPNASETDPFNTGKGAFTITRSSAVGSLTVNFAMAGTAYRGYDFILRRQGSLTTFAASSITFADGESAVVIEVIPIDDTYVEPIKAIRMTLNSNPAYNLDPVVANRTATVNLTSND